MKNRRHLDRRNQAEQRYRKHRQRNLLARHGVHEFIVVLDHLKAGFNVPKIFRSAQAMGAREVHLVNIPPFDPAPAKGAFKHVPAVFHDNFAACHAQLQQRGYQCFILEPNAGTPLHRTVLPLRSAFIVGNEELGISFDADAYDDMARLTISQYGPVDSLNVSVAASIVMYEYTRQHAV